MSPRQMELGEVCIYHRLNGALTALVGECRHEAWAEESSC